MNNFIGLSIEINPFEPWADVISQELSEVGFESFEQEEPILKGYVKEEGFDEEVVLKVLRSYSDHFQFNHKIEIIEAKNWNEVWEGNFQPVTIDGKVFIRAPFHASDPKVQYEILLTPKMSFGTGHHATTGTMMKEMLSLDFSNSRVLDVGCGTSILSILAEKLGASQILAIDNDEWAVTNSIENADINQCKNIVVENAEVQSVTKTGFNIILANINRNVILKDISIYAKLLDANGHLLLSGFHKEDVDQIMNLALSLGLCKINLLSEKEWCMLHLTFNKD